MGIVIAGGGLAAQRCAETLRARGHEGAIRMVCAEGVRPYDRPPLSKEALAGEPALDTVALRPEGWYTDNDVELIAGAAAALDPVAGVLRLDDGTRLPYDALLIATGSEPRMLPLLDRFSNVSALRTLDDAARLCDALRPGARLAVVGAGFVGQEVASTARSLGVAVTMIDAAPAPLAPVLGAELGGWFADLHRDEGVDVVLDTMLAGARGNGRVEQLELPDGRRIECDHALVGVGVGPATAWLAGSGLETDGVRIDHGGRTALPDVYAAGDAARPYDAALGAHVRTEHWEAAGRQGQAAARAMLGLDVPPPGPGSFWSDQYGVRIQYVGHAPHADEVTLDGDPHERDFTALFRRGGHVVAGLLVGRPRALPELRRTVQAGLGSLQPA